MDEELQHDTPIETPESNEPETMLEAIQEGLQGDEEPPPLDDGETTDRPRDEAGRFARKAGDKPEDAKPAETPEDEMTMPEGLSEKAQARFRKLAGRVHELSEAHEAAQRSIEEFRDVVRSTGASPQDFSMALDYLRAMNSGDMQTALRIVEDQRRMISLAIGQPLPGADALAEFPDLRQRVQAYQMDESAALEIARARVMQREQAQRRHGMEQQYQQQAAVQQTRAQAIGEIDRLGTDWAKTDPDYAIKEEVILKQLPTIAREFPPNMWPHQVRLLYQSLSAMPMPAQRSSNPPPLRPSGQTAGARQPGSMLEALQAGLGYGNG